MIAFKKHFHGVVSSTADQMFYPSPTISPEEVAMQLGGGTAQIYTWVRSKLNIPMNRGLQDDPLYNAQKGLPTKGKKSIGSSVSMVYESLLKGEMMDVILEGWTQD
jgi:phenylalanine ammonia-lyase